MAPRILDLNVVVTEAGRLIARVLGEDIEFTMQPAVDLWPIEADPARLQQALLNLAVNARDAMPDGGKLDIAVKENDGHVLMSFADTGKGIETEVKDKIFDPFFTTKGPTGGTGLGLSICYSIVKDHGGAIRLVSPPGEGAAFAVLLPAAGGQPSAVPRPSARRSRWHGVPRRCALAPRARGMSDAS